MRNLKLVHSYCYDDWCGLLDDASHISIDFDTGRVFVSTRSDIFGFDYRTKQMVKSTDGSLVAAGYLNDSIKIVGFQYVPDQFSVCVATSSGDLILWSIETEELECVGSVDSGLQCMSWSPDHELLLLITGQATIIMMTKDFEPVTEVNMHPSDFGEAKFITVGWGKKETQFHGSEGKAAAQVKKQEVKPALPWDDKCPRISWRGDGELFVVSCVCPETGSRKLRVWSRDCVHLSTSENVDGIEHALAWRPSGNLITSTQRKPNKHDVVFFERNGLRHGEFTLPFKRMEVQVNELLWNTDSTVLCVWCEELKPENSEAFVPKSFVQLWTTGNYHWYLKQQLEFQASSADRVAVIEWDPESPYRLHIVCQNGRYLQYTWCWFTDSDDATVAVIDKEGLLVTPFRTMVVPPPISATTLQTTSQVSQSLFCSNGSIAAILSDNQIATYEWNDGSGKPTEEKISKCNLYKIDRVNTKLVYPLMYTHFTWLKSGKLLFVQQSDYNQDSVLQTASFDIQTNSWIISSSESVDGSIIAISVSSESGHVAVEVHDGLVFQYLEDNQSLVPWQTSDGMELAFPQPCTQIQACDIGGEEVVLGLTERYRLYVNNVEVASNCTSFALHEEFLLLTTHAHTCRCICRKTKVSALPSLSDGKAHPFDESIRRVERGSRIVTVVPDDTKLVLQMPRGNLETIHPRALVLSSVRKLIDQQRYDKAFICMKKHRINMNLLYDHNPSQFLECVDNFVKQIQAVNHINLFLTDLIDDDVTQTMYTAAYNKDSNSKTNVNKVDVICDAVRHALEQFDSDKYFLSILTAYVRKKTPDLETALLRIKQLRDAVSTQSNQTPVHVSPEEALKYLLFLVDVNELYDVALGMYDFDLVIMVAEKSQKDPKEYLPFLNQLRLLEENYQHYSIDKFLKRYKKALEHISKCGPDRFPECLSLVKEHRLYSQALQLYPNSSQEYQELSSIYGQYLSDKKQYEEAGIIYCKGQHWQQALTAFEGCLNWRQCFCMAVQLNYNGDQMKDLAHRLAGELKLKGYHADAGFLYEQYADDYEEGIVTLIEGQVWEEALRLMYKHRRLDFLETNFKPALEDNYNSYVQLLDCLIADFERYSLRLNRIREEKEKDRLELLEGEGHFNHADADLFSDTSSATGDSVVSSRSQKSSVMTRTTGKSSRNKKKSEKKKWSLKEGSAYEDLALVDALAKIITRIDTLKDEISPLLKMLVLYSYEKQASHLQNTLQMSVARTEKEIPVIWQTNDQEEVSLGPEATANTIAQAVQQGRSLIRSELEKDPVLKAPPVIKNSTNKWSLNILNEKS